MGIGPWGGVGGGGQWEEAGEEEVNSSCAGAGAALCKGCLGAQRASLFSWLCFKYLTTGPPHPTPPPLCQIPRSGCRRCTRALCRAEQRGEGGRGGGGLALGDTPISARLTQQPFGSPRPKSGGGVKVEGGGSPFPTISLKKCTLEIGGNPRPPHTHTSSREGNRFCKIGLEEILHILFLFY